MAKVRMGPSNMLLPMPLVLVGAEVDGRANFLAIAYCGIINHAPPTIAVALRRNRFTAAGIKRTKHFSVNAVSEDMLEAADYCGIHSGAQVDKSRVFEVVYGEAQAPLIAASPCCMECKLKKTLNLDTHEVFIGEITEVYMDEEALTEGSADLSKVRPVVFGIDASYWGLGLRLGNAFQMGKNFAPSS